VMLGGAVATLTLLAVLPLVAGTVLITRPPAVAWFPGRRGSVTESVPPAEVLFYEQGRQLVLAADRSPLRRSPWR